MSIPAPWHDNDEPAGPLTFVAGFEALLSDGHKNRA